MQQSAWLIYLGSLVLLLASCGSNPGNDRTQTAPAAPATSSQTTPPLAKQDFANPTVKAAQPDNLPAVPVKATQSGNLPVVPGMLQSTKPSTRLAQRPTNGRPDPFAAVLPSGQIPLIRQPAPQPQPNSPVMPTAQQPRLVPLPPSPLSTALPPAPVAANPAPSAPLPPAPVLAPPTNLANDIQVMGVVQLRGRWTAIVKAPNEATARSVSTGDYLAGGQVLVKQIMMSKGASPIVVFQQNGIEVIKRIG